MTTLVGKPAVIGDFDSVGSSALFNYVSGVSWDGDSNLILVDRFNHRIRGVHIPTARTWTLAGGSKPASYAEGVGVLAAFNEPYSTAMDLDNSFIYVGDVMNFRVRRITYPEGVVTTAAGTGTAGNSDGHAHLAMLNCPTSLALRPADGAVFVADGNNHNIRVIKNGWCVNAWIEEQRKCYAHC